MRTFAMIIIIGLVAQVAQVDSLRFPERDVVLPGAQGFVAHVANVWYRVARIPANVPRYTTLRFVNPIRFWLGHDAVEWVEWWGQWTDAQWASWSLGTRVQGQLYSYEEWLSWYAGFAPQGWADWVQGTGHANP